MTTAYDVTKKRPLEIRVIDRREDGGVSEEAARESNGSSADMLLMFRVLSDDGTAALAYSAIDGATGATVSFEMLFNLWLAFTNYLSQVEVQDPAHEVMQKFAARLISMMEILSMPSTKAEPTVDA
jgi:hypothetical protein